MYGYYEACFMYGVVVDDRNAPVLNGNLIKEKFQLERLPQSIVRCFETDHVYGIVGCYVTPSADVEQKIKNFVETMQKHRDIAFTEPDLYAVVRSYESGVKGEESSLW